MKRSFKFVVLAILVAISFGCVAQREVDKLRISLRKCEEQHVDLLAQLDEKDAQIAALQDAAADPEQLRKLLADREQLQAALAEAELKLREAASSLHLPVDLSNALRDLAEGNPSLMSYDEDLGMVKLSGDLTFSLGSTQINPAAATSLRQLADVLNTPAAQPFEIRIVGHTDNVPVRVPDHVQKFGDNWGLSAFRAIAVKDIMQKAGISPVRIGVAGYGEFRSVVPNGPKGAQANRRVEIYLVAMGISPSVDHGGDDDAPSSTNAVSEPSKSPDPPSYK